MEKWTENSPRRRALTEYVKWRGDLPFGIAPFNEIDALILSQLAYLHFGDIAESDGLPFFQLAPLLAKLPPERGNAQAVADRHRLFDALCQSTRFGGLRAERCADRLEPTLQMQFAAVTFALPDDSRVIAYRGTDATVVGWREDFNMSFACPVPSQAEALRYLQDVAANTHGPLRLCGHSKGGNLAMYAAAYCEPGVRERIDELYLFDAPGLDDATLALPGYRQALEKVLCYVPQGSVIGRLMGVPERYTVVHSRALGIAQHDVFTWVLNGPRFETLPTLDAPSRLTKATVDEFLRGSTPETRRLFVDTLFDALSVGSAHTLSEVAGHLPDTAGALWTTLRSLDPAARKAVLSVAGSMALSGAQSAKRMLLSDRGVSGETNPN